MIKNNDESLNVVLLFGKRNTYTSQTYCTYEAITNNVLFVYVGHWLFDCYYCLLKRTRRYIYVPNTLAILQHLYKK